MTTNQPEPQGIAEYDAKQASSDVIDSEQSTPDLSAIKRILLAMAMGVAVGLLAGGSAVKLGLVGSKIIGMIKTLAGPLILFAVLESFLKTEMTWKQAGRMLRVAAINGCCAVAIGLMLANVIQPGVGWKPAAELTVGAKAATIKPTDRKIDPVKDILAYIPENIVQPFIENQVISIVMLAVVAGASLRSVQQFQQRQGRTDYVALEHAVVTCFEAIQQVMRWVVMLVPLAVFSVVAKAVGEGGLGKLAMLGPYVLVVLGGLFLQILIVYQAWIVTSTRYTLKQFWAAARHPVTVALGTSSSLATMRDTLIALEQKLGVSKTSSRLAACVGTNLNNDGILLYEAMAVLFVAQYEGISLSLGQQALAALSCIIAGIGIGGVPDAGLISLTIVLATVGLPQEIVPLLLAVDWLLSRARAMTNVISDMTLAATIDGKNET
jgi:Na+/H+-dicarboxylate symporter